MQKYLICAASLFLWANISFCQTTKKVEVNSTSTNDTPTQAVTREKLKSDVAQKEQQNDGWEVMSTEATIYVPPADNDLQKSINKEGATIISREEFNKKFKNEK